MTTNPEVVGAVALLHEPVRRRLYDWAAEQGRAVSRDEAAAAVGVSRALAAFHLDRLAEAGLLAIEYRRLSGRTGPGAGRPAKLYRRAEQDVAISLPDRRYSVAAELFATALELAGGPIPSAPVTKAAHETGHAVGVGAREAAGARPGRARLQEALLAALEARGFQPRRTSDGEVRLGNCPFDALVDRHRDLVCGMNLALAQGMLAGLGDAGLAPRLDPQPGWCCVALAPEGLPVEGRTTEGPAGRQDRSVAPGPGLVVRDERPGQP